MRISHSDLSTTPGTPNMGLEGFSLGGRSTDRVRADIHDGQQRCCFIQGPDTEAQDKRLQITKSSLQRTAGPYKCAKCRSRRNAGSDGQLSPFGSGTGRASQCNSKPNPVRFFLTMLKEPLFAYSADMYRVLLSRLSTFSGASGRRYVVLSR
jgi:hypothetical protein